jgi:hypothetical protein
MQQHSFDSIIRLGSPIWVFYISLMTTFILSTVSKPAENNTPKITNVNRIQTEESIDGNTSAIHFLNIKPTVLFVKEQSNLLQLVEITIMNTARTTELQLDIRIGTWEQSKSLGKVGKGESNFDIYVPDINKPTPAEFFLKTNNTIWDHHKMEWQPQRHWEVFMVPISHHDLGYTDAIENILLKHDGFYDDILRFCEETRDFPEESKYRYTAEVAWSIKHFIENRPKEVVEKLKKYIKERRIEVHAFFGNEITGLCSHEELIRLMYPSFRLKQEYGITVDVGSATDVAGLSWGIPTVLTGAGVRYFYGGMPNYGIFFKEDEAAYYLDKDGKDIHQFWDESAVLRHGRQPEAFRWEGPTGESVLFYYGGTGGVGCYGCWRPESYEDARKRLPAMLKRMEENGSQFSVVRYGTYGCYDNEPPDIRPSLIAKEWNNKWAYPKLIVATSSMFFRELEKQCQDVRVFRGELTHTDYVRGVMSTARETSINRITHDKLHSAEKFATIASLVSDYPYPTKKIQQAYDNMLLYDEHTWGMGNPSGTIQDWNWSDKSHFAFKAAGLTESILSSSLYKIASSIKLKDEGTHIVVFNPLSFSRTDIVRVIRFGLDEPFDIIDEETGQKILYQIYEINGHRAPVPHAGQRYAMGELSRWEILDLIFVAENVPPLGYKTYRLMPTEKTADYSSNVIVSDVVLENSFFKVVLNPRTGAIESIYDKELDREIVDKEAPYHVNQFIARATKTLEQQTIENVKICKGQQGSVYGSVVISGEGVGCPQITQEIILYDKIKRIDCANRILKDYTPLWELYFAFPFKMNDPSFRYEGSHAVIQPLVDQFPGSNTSYYPVQHWANVSDGKTGITLSPIESHLLEFGGLWPCYISPGMHVGVMPLDIQWIESIPTKFTKGHIFAYVLDSNFRTNFSSAQQGDLLFRYSITTHKEDWKSGRSSDFGWAIGNPLIPVIVNNKTEGSLERNISFAQVDKPNVLILTLKQAEDNDGIIIRLIETEGQEDLVTVTLPYLSIRKCYLTNLVEENIKEAAFNKHKITVPVKAFGITTIRLQTHD